MAAPAPQNHQPGRLALRPGTTEGEDEGNLGESFATDTPNPQPSQPLPAAEESTESPAADEVAGERQLAFTGPDVRIFALAMLLIGVGLVFAIASRRQEMRLAEVEAWLE